MPTTVFTVKLSKQLSLRNYDASNWKSLFPKTVENKYQSTLMKQKT